MHAYTHEEIAAAAKRLSDSDFLKKIIWEIETTGTESPLIPKLLMPRIEDILVMLEAAKVIAQVHDVKIQKESYEDYTPVDELPKHLCQRFSDLPQYAKAPEEFKHIIWSFGLANVIGIYLAGDSEKFVSSVPGIENEQKKKFYQWVGSVLDEREIKRDDMDIVCFQPYAALTLLLRHPAAQDSFHWLKDSSSSLSQEPLLKSDCEQLLKMGINHAADLAQTSVSVLKQTFSSDGMKRLSVFLTKRHLHFGMKFPAER